MDLSEFTVKSAPLFICTPGFPSEREISMDFLFPLSWCPMGAGWVSVGWPFSPGHLKWWLVPWTEECCGLQSTGLQRVGQDWVANTFTFSATFTTDALWALWKWKLYSVSPQHPSTQHSSHLEESLFLLWVLGGMNYKLTANFSPVEDLLERCWAIIWTVKWWTTKTRKEGPAGMWKLL